MATYKSFEDLPMWKASRELAALIYKSNSLQFQKDFGLKSQMQRAAVSISSNIAEGFERDGNKEFIQFLSISKGSCGETRSQLYRAIDNEYITQEEFDLAYDKTLECSKMLKGFIIYLKDSELKGNIYK